MRHPKFRDEKVCPICKCSFLSPNKNQTQCLGCNSNPTPDKEIVSDDVRVEKTDVKSKECKKCGTMFEYKHPAAKFCNNCKK